MSVIVLHDLLYVLGGRSEFNDDNSSVEIYNPYTDIWEYGITSSSGVVSINGGVVVNRFPDFVKRIIPSSSPQISLSRLNGAWELKLFHGASN